MITEKQFKEVLMIAEETNKEFPNWRKGQSVFNTLCNMHPDTAENIRTTELDMFYDDKKIDKFETYIKEQHDNR